MKEDCKRSICSLFKNKTYMGVVALLAVAAYGFEITHFSLGIDDFAIRHYMDLSPSSYGNMLQQGRLLHIVFYYLTGLVDVIPFLSNLLATVFLFLSAVLFTGVMDAVASPPPHFRTWQKILFSGLYLTNSIIAFKFIYDIDVVVTMFSYACVPLALVFAFGFVENNNRKDFVKAVAFLFFSIGSYESFNAVYICAVLFILILFAIYRDKKAKDLTVMGLKFAIILLVAFVTYYALVKLLQSATGNLPYERQTIFSMGFPIFSVLKTIAKRLLNPNLFFAIEFTVFAVISVFLAIYYTVKKKSAFLFLLFACFGFFALSVQIAQGYLYYRTCQTFNLFIACIALLLLDLFGAQKVLAKITAVLMTLLVIWQCKDINLWFYKDWANYQKNVYALHVIATDLNSGYNVAEKPVCFFNRDYESFLMTWDEDQQEIGESPIVSAIAFLGDQTSPCLIQLFEYQGYDFLLTPSEEQVEEARKYTKEMPAYPKEGYIKELDDVIIVNLGTYKEG